MSLRTFLENRSRLPRPLGDLSKDFTEIPFYEDRPLFERAWTERLEKGTPASVLVLIGDDSILLTRRSEHLDHHQGQIAFPGGVADSEDGGDVIRTALRETEEEVGIPTSAIEIFGALPPLPTGTGFRITPVVGMTRNPAAEISLRLNAEEIAEAFWIRWEDVLNPQHYRRETFESPGPLKMRLPTHVYHLGGRRVWGATAAILRGLHQWTLQVGESSTP